MAKSKSKSSKAEKVVVESDELAEAEKVVLESDLVRIKINTAVNGHQPGDTMIVAIDHPFYMAIVKQNLAEIVED